jgi:hypothetical protein
LLEAGVKREYQRPCKHARGGVSYTYDPSPFVSAGYEWHYNECCWVPFSQVLSDPLVHGYKDDDRRLPDMQKQPAPTITLQALWDSLPQATKVSSSRVLLPSPPPCSRR